MRATMSDKKIDIRKAQLYIFFYFQVAISHLLLVCGGSGTNGGEFGIEIESKI